MKKNAKLSLNKGVSPNLDDHIKGRVIMSFVECQMEDFPTTLDDCASWAIRYTN